MQMVHIPPPEQTEAPLGGLFWCCTNLRPFLRYDCLVRRMEAVEHSGGSGACAGVVVVILHRHPSPLLGMCCSLGAAVLLLWLQLVDMHGMWEPCLMDCLINHVVRAIPALTDHKEARCIVGAQRVGQGGVLGACCHLH